ncbi:hypothetical protein [Blastopirellula marina]|uniref:ApeA N-terminal domain-containing protein n=1 Tax=Blastopirellula marina DSM 3645 TaxID=314230 RepID=A3ZNK6_9BACT|nr:hypothetical protein [Blastopirellula marina]EAQ81901.1 hypothetical protein DSM3645_17155 [Blastopirellula marina DSM 3645]
MSDHSDSVATVVTKALQKLEVVLKVTADELQGDFIDPRSNLFEPGEINLEDEIVLGFPRCDDGIELTYGQLPALVGEVSEIELVGNLECWTSNQLCMRIAPVFPDTSFYQLEELVGRGVLQSVHVDGNDYELSFVSGATIFGFAVLKFGYWDKYIPPLLSEDFFISVRWTGAADRNVVRRLVDSLIFELAASFNVNLERSPRPETLVEFEQFDTLLPDRELRPLVHDEGLAEVLRLYSFAIATSDPQFQIIGFVKVLEHISVTVVREDLTAAVRTKLLSSRALEPDAEYILDLVTEINCHKSQHRKDSDALLLTIQKCCDPTELARCAPHYLQIRKINVTSSQKDRDAALKQFSAAISATRNEIVHAKLNYEKTGDECPEEFRSSFAKSCRVAAEQAIRWFALQHKSLRVDRFPD